MAETTSKSRNDKSINKTIAAACVCFVAGMVGMSYAAVPLYELFCRVTGYGGTTQRAEVAPNTIIDHEITVRFDANVASGLNWDFEPVEKKMTLKVGETEQGFYRITNLDGITTAGTASFNVSPPAAGAYFNKLECFCFTEQAVKGGESIDMPVIFFIDPAYLEDRDVKDVTTITLSYTYFPTDLDEEELARLDTGTSGEQLQ
ncbi:MAG: cytochrome c oxidase assembly protein [Pseudomonadota bacterium]